MNYDLGLKNDGYAIERMLVILKMQKNPSLYSVILFLCEFVPLSSVNIFNSRCNDLNVLFVMRTNVNDSSGVLKIANPFLKCNRLFE